MNRRTFLSSCVGLAFLGKFLPSITAKTTPTTPSQSQSLDLSLLLQCIAEVESGNRDDLVGPCGARSKYQITERLWYQYSPLNFAFFCKGDRAYFIAREHMDWLYEHLNQPSAFWLAYAWHGGLTAATNDFQSAKVHKLRHDYATRVTNLYYVRHRSQ